MGEEQDQDELMITELRAFFAEADPTPPLVKEAAKAAFGWRRLDADLAELLSDSALDESFALARGGGTPGRSLTFTASELTIDLEIHEDAGARLLLGQLSPPAAAIVEIQTIAEPHVSAETDDLGRFRASVPAGAIRLRILEQDRPSGPAVETSWVTV